MNIQPTYYVHHPDDSYSVAIPQPIVPINGCEPGEPAPSAEPMSAEQIRAAFHTNPRHKGEPIIHWAVRVCASITGSLREEIKRLRCVAEVKQELGQKLWESGQCIIELRERVAELEQQPTAPEPGSAEQWLPSARRCYCVCHQGFSSRNACVHCHPEYWEKELDPYCHMTAGLVQDEKQQIKDYAAHVTESLRAELHTADFNAEAYEQDNIRLRAENERLRQELEDEHSADKQIIEMSNAREAEIESLKQRLAELEQLLRSGILAMTGRARIGWADKVRAVLPAPPEKEK